MNSNENILQVFRIVNAPNCRSNTSKSLHQRLKKNRGSFKNILIPVVPIEVYYSYHYQTRGRNTLLRIFVEKFHDWKWAYESKQLCNGDQKLSQQENDNAIEKYDSVCDQPPPVVHSKKFSKSLKRDQFNIKIDDMKRCVECNKCHSKYLCKQCRKVRYCSRKCQKRNWVLQHKGGCLSR